MAKSSTDYETIYYNSMRVIDQSKDNCDLSQAAIEIQQKYAEINAIFESVKDKIDFSDLNSVFWG